ncbi:calnexin isoform X1 [Diprion similis]|uniref:calnexin isoform X1 n=1 Tax=Diprion similis TaxID=362088 RepID=UPI001EF91E68|nr:calnexin isoform X1 [Diprion similis]XP_046747741.1 calnexin isoform X1 [Diprion similis]XP_046747742.1 calnexin isoform X1 [Diprion similis]XP_046747743.1 calnexin isoform X1 [Diprion similis]
MDRLFVTVLFSLLFSGFNADKDHIHNEDFSDTLNHGYRSPVPKGFAYLAEHFDDPEHFRKQWVLSEAKKDDTDEEISKYDGIWKLEEASKYAQEGDTGLVLKSKARHAAISAPLSRPFYFDDKPLVVQYEVILQDGQECGGAYLKLLTLDSQHKDLKLFNDKTPYTIMFGPDKCGNDHKLHFIFRHQNPLNGSFEEKHCKKPKDRLEDAFKDKQPHLYTLIVRPDNTFQVKLDNSVVNEGSLLDDFTPPVNPPLEIEDPNDKRPENWDEREKIPDPLAIKPEDWDEDAPAQIIDEEAVMPDGWLEDESAMIPDSSAIKPEDWDNEMDGDWEPPMLSNPLCEKAPGCGPWKQPLKQNPRFRGKWLAPLINNPNYKGKWMPRLIHNPAYFNDEHPFKMTPIFAVGFELWSMSPDILFDNLIITDSEEVAKKWSDDSFELRRARIAQQNETLWGRMMHSMNNKPGWWAIYFIYCAIPVVLYVSYLIKRSGEDKQDFKPEDREPLQNEDLNEEESVADEEDTSAENKETEQKNKEESDGKQKELVEPDELENSRDSDEVVTEESINKEKPLAGGDGPRRRKPNKE